MKNKIIVFTVLCLLIMTACKTTRLVTKPAFSTTNAVAEVIEKVVKVQPDFQSANVNKMSLAFNMNEREVNVSAVCKIKKRFCYLYFYTAIYGNRIV